MANEIESQEKQLEILESIQYAGFNVVTCDHCGCILLVKTDQDEIECFCCGFKDESFLDFISPTVIANDWKCGITYQSKTKKSSLWLK